MRQRNIHSEKIGDERLAQLQNSDVRERFLGRLLLNLVNLINFPQLLLDGLDIGIHSAGSRYVTLLSVAEIVCEDFTNKKMTSSKTVLRSDEEKVQWK
ncbi:uncharacterized protein Bfra_008816 [Botrytis fragariae]|uniref:Uncharacterized protein n=1 Tax=Botrytis fragariae TaxID=1964551 RepID=A0A8H6AQK2_9HELO|nr:uncharacterized protein Bfra_008816 [Botrytis fragariae]KAF5871792.1 hypothetical protein Bfra_008816 [Botrytis fragariae]